MKTSLRFLLLATIPVLVSFGCGGSGSGDNGAPPAAPTGLSIMLMDAKPHLTWSDNADNELGFSIERKTGAGAFVEIGNETFDIEQFHDTSAAAGTSYTYRVMATNATAMSAPTAEISISTP